MKIKATLVPIFFIGSLCIASNNAYSEIIIEDSFESGNMSTTNTDGFFWGVTTTTSVVTENPQCGGHSQGTPTAIFKTSAICDGPRTPAGGGNWRAKHGNNSLMFYYPAGQHWTEQRFDLGTPRRELWISYWLRVPTNFTYGPGDRRNNKFFSLWMDDHGDKGDGSTLWLGMEPYNNTGATLGFTYTHGKKTGSVGFQQHTPFITTADRGRWMQIVLHFKAESNDGADDGIIQTFRRWDSESSFTKLHEKLNAPLRVSDAGTYGFKVGYILGWANAPYENDTEWLLDSWTISDTPILDIQVAPKPPGSMTVQ